MSYAELMGFKKNFGFYDGPTGMPCNLTIITLPQATVTITLGTKSYTTTADEAGYARFSIGDAGLWSVVSVKEDVTQIGTVQVENVVTKALALPTSLESLTWSEISAISRAGLAAQNFNIGDTKQIRTTDGGLYIFEIIGFDHDDVEDGHVATYGRTKAGITFQTKFLSSASKRMSSGSQTWEDSEMRLVTLPAIKEQLPSDLTNLICPVKKYTVASFTNAVIDLSQTVDDLFFLSRVEISNNQTPHPNEGTQYKFYADGRSRVKYDATNTARNYWTRTTYTVDANVRYASISTTGTDNYYVPSSTTPYFMFAFCV